ncbi:MAG: hypothetical protein HOW73_23730 [Polyangiaceae bacterium]|nr:hypothetical protein [Polyangiaceae bacterium]
MRIALIAASLSIASCKMMAGSSTADEMPVTIYGVGDKPSDPPDSCKFVERIEVTRIERKDPPLEKIEDEARARDANAVAHIRREGFKDGYLGKEYRFVATVYRCPEAKPAPSASSVGP